MRAAARTFAARDKDGQRGVAAKVLQKYREGRARQIVTKTQRGKGETKCYKNTEREGRDKVLQKYREGRALTYASSGDPVCISNTYVVLRGRNMSSCCCPPTACCRSSCTCSRANLMRRPCSQLTATLARARAASAGALSSLERESKAAARSSSRAFWRGEEEEEEEEEEECEMMRARRGGQGEEPWRARTCRALSQDACARCRRRGTCKRKKLMQGVGDKFWG
jgi:hypothetical protein